MPTTQAAALTFVPWVRQGAASAITRVDTLGAAQPAVADLAATVAVNGNALPVVTVRLRGPADVLGIDRNQIIRMDPAPDSHDGEPTYFACIEFDRADFPWLFTPAKAAANAKLRPWLVLVVVRKQPGVTIAAGAATPLPTVQITTPALAANELPDLSESWAWAHAQAAAADTSAMSVQAALQGSPALSLSRLVCPRILEPDTDYVACVVPAFDVGRRAGLGLPVSDDELVAANALAPAWAWSPTLADVLLPVYHQWSFRTGPGGDFATLVARLQPRPAPDGLGKRPIAIGDPGFMLPQGFPSNATLLGEGALRALTPEGRPDQMAPWPDGTEVAFKDALAPIVNAPGENAALDPDADPLLAPPLYGRWHARRNTVTRTQHEWFDELNLDPRLRSTAGFGTRVIQRNQEALVASAWEQAGALVVANQRLRQLQLSCAIGERLQVRHFAGLSPDAALRVNAPLLARAAATGVSGVARNMLEVLAATPVPLRALGPAMRRIARQRGPLTRRLAVQGLQRSASWLASLNAGDAHLPAFAVPDIVTFNAVITHLPPPATVLPFSAVTDAEVAARPGLPWFVVRAEGEPVPIAFSFTHGPATNDSSAARDFRRAAAAHLARVRPNRSPPTAALVVGADLGQVARSLALQTQALRSVSAFARSVIAPAPTRPTGGLHALVAGAVDALRTIDIVPTYTQPMVEALRDVSQDLVLPGLDAVLEDSVLGLETNRRFVEAFMVGLNFEMARELVWRGFPTRQDGTSFDRFWGGGPDVPPLETWGTRALGDPSTAEPRERFVMLIRSALLRRYPNALIYLTPAIVTGSARAPSDDPALEKLPVFSGAMPPDVSYFGFDVTTAEVVGKTAGGTGDGYYLVIQQHPTEPRFGLHPGASAGSAVHVAASSAAPAGQPPDGHEWGRNGAHMAAILRRLPVRLAIHASLFLSAKP